MSNLWRAIRLSFKYRFSVIAVIVCAILIGVLWGCNISAVFPFIETVFRGKSPQEWVKTEIAKSQARVEDLDEQLRIANLQTDLTAKKTLEYQREKESTALATYQKLQPWIDQYLPHNAFSTLIWVMAFVLLGTLLKGGFIALSDILTERLAQRGTMELREQFFRHALYMDLQQFDEVGQKELMSRFTYDLEQLTVGLRTIFGRSIREPLKIIACLTLAGLICWRLLLASLILAPLGIIAIGVLNRTIRRANRNALDQMSNIYNVLSESLRAIKVVKSSVGELHEQSRMSQAGQRFYNKAMRVGRFNALVRPTIEILGMATISVAVISGAYLVLNQQTQIFGVTIADRPLSISSMMLFFAMMAGISDPARKMSGVIGRLQRAAAAADRIYELIELEPRVRNVDSAVALERHKHSIEFKDVNFSYNDDQRILNRVSLNIQHGETIAIVGPNGCGKTTLANLLLRFYDPQSGSILIDGVEIKSADLSTLRRQIGLVTQNTLLFNESIADNIRYGNPTATLKHIKAAAKQAHALEFVENQLCDGLETCVGEGGSRLSGGQRQRIALARAFCQDPSILVLDEATSQIDLESEFEIHRILKKYLEKRTALIITHRLAILELADRIIVMDNGVIAAMGSFQHLQQKCPIFQRLIKSQFRISA